MRAIINTCIIFYFAIGYRLLELLDPNADDA